MAEEVSTYQGDEDFEDAGHVSEMLEKAEGLEKPTVDDRPEWLPEKFNSPQDMANAYSELETKLHNKDYREEQTLEDESHEQHDENDYAMDESQQDSYYHEFSQEYLANGDLSEQSYDRLWEERGLSREMVDSYIAGQESIRDSIQDQAYEITGSPENYTEMVMWATNNLSNGEINAFNSQVNSGDPDQIILAVEGLNSRFANNVGTEPSLVQGETSMSTTGGFNSIAELTSAMKDPRYDSDTAYRQQVAAKLNRSNIL
jgi:hypothetical protein